MEHEFKAEISELMNLIVNAFYSDKDIFLRELISNASDAINKATPENPTIKININKENKIITIQDNGIGMDRNDMQNNLGKIAHSGTKSFVESLKYSNDSKLIGQFGVGFYSSFLVADLVKVYSSLDGEKCYCWESDIRNNKNYRITSSDELKERGTKIELHVRDKDKAYLSTNKLKKIINKHSLYVVHPILLYQDNDYIQLNKEKSIWSRNPSTVQKDEYRTFYKNLSNNQDDDYLAVKHFHVEGNITLQGVLYVPLRKDVDHPFKITRDDKQKKNNIKIYSKNVFIMDRCEDFVPHWLSFIKGIIDSSDIPLNVSREMLQHGSTLMHLESTFIKKSLELFDTIADNDEKMQIFYQNYSKNIKMGVNKKNKHSQKLIKFLRYHTNTGGSNLRSLDEYISDMKHGQKGIYFITGSSLEQIFKSPYLERFNDKGIEVLYMDDPMDECMMQFLQQYKGINFISVCKEKADIDKIDKKTRNNYNHLCDVIKNVLGGKVEKVHLSTRIVQTPACLVASEKGWSANMERIMAAQALRGGNQIQFQKTKKILEINPNHPIIQNIKETLENSSEKNIVSIVNLIYDLSCFHSGYQLDNAADFSEKMYNMIEIGLGLHDRDEPSNDNEEINEEINVL
jgi:molecular chaperone HtpG